MTEQVIKLGFSGYGKQDYGYIPKMEFSKFATEINEKDIWTTINEIYKGEKEAIKSKDTPLIEKMFNNIAQDDGIIQESELKDYLEKLAEKAKSNADPEILDAEELYEFCEENGIVKKKSKFRKFLENIFGNKKKIHEKTIMHKFMYALLMTNDVIVTADEIMAQLKAEREAEMAARTSYDKNGNKVYTDDDGYKIVYDKDDPDKKVAYDNIGRVYQKQYRDGDATVTEMYNYENNKKNSKAEKYVLVEHDNGDYEKTFYYTNGKMKYYSLHDEEQRSTYCIDYDEKGRESYGRTIEFGIVTERFTKEYHKNGKLKRCETNYYDWLYGNLEKTEILLYDENGNEIDCITKKPGNAGWRYY